MALMRTMVRPEALLVGAHLRGQVGQRRLVAELAAQLLAGGFELAPLAAHAARPGVLAQGVDHRAPDPTLGECLELDAARLVEPVRRVDQADDAVLNEIADVDRVGHRGGDATGKLLDERETGCDARTDCTLALGAHECDLRRQVRQPVPTLESARISSATACGERIP